MNGLQIIHNIPNDKFTNLLYYKGQSEISNKKTFSFFHC